MNKLPVAVEEILSRQYEAKKPLAVILAGHNGSGKSTLWRKQLGPKLQIPLINADRMVLSMLPETGRDNELVDWARLVRDNDEGWMRVAQNGVQAFVAQALAHKVPFAMETVFSHWNKNDDGSFASKADLIRDMQKAGYFVLLFFVGLTSKELSILRVRTRVAENGHAVDEQKLSARFPRTQLAVADAATIADATIMADNSGDLKEAFTVCRVQLGEEVLFDIRQSSLSCPTSILNWLAKVAPVG